jgi:phosphoribosyl-AMP cyclohydrolase / phosphoribosyl-ATP pyrophosphohydrolase
MIDTNSLNYSKGNGLVTVVAQDQKTHAVLMVAHADAAAIAKTIETGEMHYQSRSRGLWHKGATSGNTQRMISLAADCDGDAVLAVVAPRGPACHTGMYSCFGETPAPTDTLRILDETIAARAASLVSSKQHAPQSSAPSYTKRLLTDRNLRLKKIGEEAAEFIAACADADADRAVGEAADLLYHTAVALHAVGASLEDVLSTLAARGSR